MKYIIFLLLISAGLQAQVLQETNGRRADRINVFKEGLRVPIGDTATTPFLLNYSGDSARGGVVYDTTLSKLCFWTGIRWVCLDDAGASGFVPYTGAIGKVYLGDYGLQTDHVDFTEVPISADTARRLSWDSTYGTLDFNLRGNNVTLQVGQELVVLCRNNTGVAMTDGQVVYIAGSTGEVPTIALANNNTFLMSSRTLGMVTEPIAHGAQGFVTITGIVNGLNTLAFNEGDPLWLGSTDGSYTSTLPVAPSNISLLGYVVKKSGGNGSIFVKAQPGFDTVYIRNQFTGLEAKTAWIQKIKADSVMIPTTATYDTTANKPTVADANGVLSRFAYWPVGSGGGSGVTTMTAFGSTANANGATISGTDLTLQPASISFPGGVSTTTQTFKGIKTFDDYVVTDTVTSTGPQLVMQQTGSVTGTTRLKILNATGQAGATFENDGVNVVDFGFKPSTGVGGVIRHEGRSASFKSAVNTLGEFQFGINLSSPTFGFAVGNAAATFELPVDINGSGATRAFLLKTSGTIRAYLGVLANGANNMANGTVLNDLVIRSEANKIMLANSGTANLVVTSTGVGVGTTAPVASAQLEVNTTTRGFLRPVQTTTQRNAISTPATGLSVYNSTNATNDVYTGAWYGQPNGLKGSATLDFASTAAQTSADLTITVTGAAVEDIVMLGTPVQAANSTFTAFVSAANTVTVRFNNYSAGAIDPASGTYKVYVIKN